MQGVYNCMPEINHVSGVYKASTRSAPKGATGLQPPKPPKTKFKKTDFVDIMI
jgi:hypothetical protein